MSEPTTNQSTGVETAPAVSDLESLPFRTLDPQVVPYWRLSGLVGWVIPMLLLLILAVGVGGAVFGSLRLSLGLWGAWGLVVGWWTWWYPPKAYAAWSYRCGDRVLELRSGVWFRVVRWLPLSRLQHVDLRRGPMQRWFGLSSLILFTAGTQEAALEIPGLAEDVAHQLRDDLVARGGDDGV